MSPIARRRFTLDGIRYAAGKPVELPPEQIEELMRLGHIRRPPPPPPVVAIDAALASDVPRADPFGLDGLAVGGTKSGRRGKRP